MKKRILSLILTAAMLLTLVPVFATSAAAADTYTITYVDSKGSGYTQEITGSGLVMAQSKCRISSSVYFFHWEGSDGNKYQIGEVITPTSDLTLTAKYSTNQPWNGYIYFYMATANFTNGLVQSGDYFLAAAYSNSGLTLKTGGTANSSMGSSANAQRIGYKNNNQKIENLPVFDYGTVARPGDGTNGVPAGYTFSHYILPSATLVAANSNPNVSADFISGLTAENTIAVYAGDTLYTSGNSNSMNVIVSHTDGTTETTTAKTAPGGGVVLIPVFKIDNTKLEATYNANFGETPETITLDNLTVPENTFVNEGYDFLYWNTQADGKGDIYNPGDVLADNNLTLYAIWGVAGQISVTYINGEEMETVTAAEILAKEVTKVGYTFLGWNTAEDGTGTTIAAGEAITESCVVYAQWKINEYKISFDANEGTTTLSNGYTVKFTATGMVEQGAASYIYKSQTWAREGYVFAGFNNKADGTGTLTWGLDKANVNIINLATAEELKPFLGADFVMYAQWVKADEIIVNYNANGGTGSMLAGGPTVLANTFTRKGYNFTGWNTQNNGKGTAYAVGATILESCTLYAQWQKISYKITFNINEGTYNVTSPSLSAISVSYDLQFGASGASNWNFARMFNTANFTREGYTFAGWNNQPDGKGAITWGLDYASCTSTTQLISRAAAEEILDATGGAFVMYALWVSDNPVDTEITLKEDATLILGEEYVTGLTVGMTVADFLAQFEDEVAVLNANGEAVTEGAMATGYKVVLVANGETVDSYEVVLYGDVDGDGDVNVNDIGVIRQHVAGTALKGAYLVAGNADRAADGDVNVNDIGTIRQHVAGTKINQGVVAE